LRYAQAGYGAAPHFGFDRDTTALLAVVESKSRSAGFGLEKVELHDEALTEMVQQIGMKLLSAEVLVGLKKLALPNADFTSAKQMTQSALSAIQQGQLGYVIITASKSRLVA
jgi:hypothetical protein